eukprot:scaffold421_cov382-Prasinococcus_capsulatus_cf.AAC.11
MIMTSANTVTLRTVVQKGPDASSSCRIAIADAGDRATSMVAPMAARAIRSMAKNERRKVVKTNSVRMDARPPTLFRSSSYCPHGPPELGELTCFWTQASYLDLSACRERNHCQTQDFEAVGSDNHPSEQVSGRPEWRQTLPSCQRSSERATARSPSCSNATSAHCRLPGATSLAFAVQDAAL